MTWVRYPVWQHTIVSPSAFSRTAVVSYWRKYVHEVLVNRLGGLSLPRKSVVRPKQNICVVPVARPCLILTPDPKHFFLYPVLNIFFYVSERPTFFPVVPDFIRHDNMVFRSTNSVNKNGGAR